MLTVACEKWNEAAAKRRQEIRDGLKHSVANGERNTDSSTADRNPDQHAYPGHECTKRRRAPKCSSAAVEMTTCMFALQQRQAIEVSSCCRAEEHSKHENRKNDGILQRHSYDLTLELSGAH